MSAGDRVDWDQGLAIAQLLLSPRAWAFRRVESIEFVDVQTVRRRVSLDFDVAAAPGLVHLRKVVPFALLARETPVKFDLFDGTGARTSLLTSAQSRAATYWALAALARRVLRVTPRPGTLDGLRALAFASDRAVAESLVVDFETATVADPEWAALLEDEDFGRWIYTLVDSFILFAPVTPGRRILKFTYLTQVERARGMRARIVRVLGSFGWLPIRYVFPTPALGETASYHLEVAAPDGLSLVAADLWVHPSEPEYELPLVKPVPGFRTIAHFYVAGGESEDRGVALLTVGAPARSLVTVSAAACLLVAVLLSIVAAVPLEGLVDLGDATSIFLAFPGLLALAAIRTGEHPVLRYVLSGLRAIVIVCGVATLVAALQIAIGLTETCLHEDLARWVGTSLCVRPSIGWWAIVAWACTALLVPPFVSAVAGRSLARYFRPFGRRTE
ncbi:MAG: hypothetical protein ABR613_04880 [Actinomycetota bacterium]